MMWIFDFVGRKVVVSVAEDDVESTATSDDCVLDFVFVVVKVICVVLVINEEYV